MDLSSMLNNGPAPSKRTSSQASTPDGNRFMGQHQLALPGGANGVQMGHGFAPSRPESHTPLYGPPSMTPNPPPSASLTPLKTPSQTQIGNQYPFPTQPNRSSDSQSASTPNAAKPPHAMQYPPHPSPSHYGPGGVVPTLHATHSTSSHSPTPPSHLSQTPHSVRQSPLSTFAQHPPGQTPVPQQYHQSQPTTPLGPPPLMHRTSNPMDRSSPFHARTLSGTSNTLAMGSPATHHPSIGSLVESPTAYNRPPSQGGRPSEQLAGVGDRERSVSVSPKTVVPPRPSSMSSRHSSQQDMHSGRSSLQPAVGNAPPHPMYQAGDVTQMSPRSTHPSGSAPIALETQSSVVHQTQKLGMSHLLAAQSQPPIRNGPYGADVPLHLQHSEDRAKPPVAGPINQAHHVSSASAASSAAAHTSPELHHNGQSRSPSVQMKQSLKRPAESDPALEPPTKRGRTRRFPERPIWAHISSENRRFGRSGVHVNAQSNANHQLPPRPQQPAARPAAARAPGPGPNGQPPMPSHANGNAADLPPWRQDPPLDGDLMHMRRLLGPWEKSMKWHTPIPSIVAAVQDWLFHNLEACADVGTDPMQGAIEIEAKIGTLINHSDGQRCNLPVCSATVIHPAANRNYRFESQMNKEEHRKMNEYLNTITQAASESGRASIQYQHLRENDSFRTLSDIGIRSLPQTAHKRPIGRELKLRTTIEDESRKVKARIVKIPLSDLHIFSPQDPYDCRISMNLEVNLNRPDVDPEALTVEPTPDKPPPPDRHKDRVSYRHLAYTVDLTRVDVKGLAPKFELELELDAVVLRQQMHLVKANAPNAFGNVIEGFLDNCAILMRHRG